MRSMGAALTRTQDTKTDVESRTTQKALRTVENTLSLLADMKLDPESATALASSGGVQHLLTMLEEDIEEPARRITGETFLELVRLRLPPPAAARRMLVGRVVRSRMLASGMMRSC